MEIQDEDKQNIFTATHQKHIKDLSRMTMNIDEYGMLLDENYIMFFCEQDLMKQHAFFLTEGMKDKDVLEIGFGLGVFANSVLMHDINSYTVIEPHPEILEHAKEWSANFKDEIQINIIEGPWQHALDKLNTYSIVMYDTWPPEEYKERDFENFVRYVCQEHLVDGGRFSFFNSGSSISKQRELVCNKYFRHYTSYRYSFTDAPPPCWTKTTTDFVIPIAQK